MATSMSPWDSRLTEYYFGQLSFLRGNRFIAQFIGNNANAAYNFDTNIGYLCREIDLPGKNMNTAQIYLGGQSLTYLQEYNPGTIRATFIDTGPELKAFNDYLTSIYDLNTGAIAYMSEAYFTTTVFEYDETGTKRATYTYQNCLLENIGNVKMNHEQATTFRTFDVSIKYLYQQHELPS